jgi:hypothetical protein
MCKKSQDQTKARLGGEMRLPASLFPLMLRVDEHRSETTRQPPFGCNGLTLGSLLMAALASSSVAADKPVAPPSPPAKPSAGPKVADAGPAWKSLFDGKTLAGWKVTDFAGHGEVEVKNDQLILGMGSMTGVTWTNELPRMSYEISLEAMRVEGSDFFCGLTFPVGKDPCSLIVGGWGGGVVGLSSLDGQDAANNETTRYVTFKEKQWYHIRLQVTPKSIRAWIDADKVVDVTTEEKAFSIRLEMEESKPLGIATWSTTAALRNIKIRKL